MDTTEITIHLPEIDVNYLEEYAKRHQITVSELIDRYVKQLQIADSYILNPEVEAHGGIIPEHTNVENDYYDYVEEKHK